MEGEMIMKRNIFAILLTTFLLLSFGLNTCFASNQDTKIPLTITTMTYREWEEYSLQHPNYIHQSYFDGPDVLKGIISTKKTLRNFSLLRVTYSNDIFGEDCAFYVEKLFTLKELTPQKPFVTNVLPVETIPHLGVSYIDNKGIEHMYGILQSGKDGSFLFSKIKGIYK